MAQPHPFFLLLIVFLLVGSNARAEYALPPALAKSYAELLKLKLNHGRDLLRKADIQGKDHAAKLLVENYADFLTLCVQQDPALYSKLIDAQEERLGKLDKLKDSSPWVGYAKAEIRGQLAINKLLFGNRLSAAWDLRKAYLQYEANAKKHPAFIPNKKGLGVLQILIGSVPDNYKWFLDIIGMRGTVKAGLQNLKAASTLSNPFREEALLYHALVQLLLDEGENMAALNQVSRLANSSPDNLLFNFVAVLMHKKAKQADRGLRYYQSRPTGNAYAAFPYMHHMAADLYLFKGDYDASIKENKMFLGINKGEHYIKASHFKLYLAYWLSDHRPQSLWFYRQVPAVGTDVTEEDSYAEQFVARNERPDRHLMIARLRSDGGYNKEALQVLQEMNIEASTPQQVKVEYLYRKARIYHGMEQLKQAKQLYDSTIKAGEHTNLYFAPNAALQLGYIYQEENNTERARYYFKKAYSYKGTAYRNSIQAKAKLGLAALK